MVTGILSIENLHGSDQLSWNFVQQIMQSQYDLAMYSLVALGILVAIVFGVRLVYNFWWTSHKLERMLSTFQPEINKKLMNASDALQKTAEEKVEQAKKQVEGSLQATGDLILSEAQRIGGLTAVAANQYSHAAQFFSRAIAAASGSRLVAGDGVDLYLRGLVGPLRLSLKHCRSPLTKEVDREIKEDIAQLPTFLDKEKKEIVDRLAKLEGLSRT